MRGFRHEPGVSDYVLAVAIAAATLTIMELATGGRPTGFLFLPVLGTAAAALRGGVGPGLLAAATSLVGCVVLFQLPAGAPWVGDPFERLRLLGLALVSVLVAWACGSLRGAYHRAASERAAAVLAAERLERQQAETRRAVAQRDEMLAVVSHDLRNPLATVSALGQLLERGAPGDPERLRNWGATIGRAAARMNRLIEDLVDSTRLETGQLRLQLRRCDPAAIARDAVEELRAIAHARGLALDFDPAPALPPLACDRQRILQVLSNVLGNAVKATPTGGSVRLRVTEAAGRVEFVVSDTGCGIAPEDLPHVFDRFRRGTRAQYAGTGLGLAIAKGLVEAHGGRIEAESSGSGTTVRVSLPVPADATAEEPACVPDAKRLTQPGPHDAAP